ncbi:uncharacterized protein LOC112639653 isoform X1 [Camponotus floridanus]|uniref:uncharacterized protein LOC112639653 isoform X1 n=1 Tax=Camponotus floridanus TaxID=104421 RepID=UPI000DC67116|nr:uncharacterized protein LOC112639653 isoform X1 [Camponotus floridanus]XP_025270182.1 uncharacterized protein LOC112639653 isoform X1 [Camponotus floridanus]
MIDSQHWKLNRILLLLIGVWPLQQSNLTRFQFIFLSIIQITSIICQLMTFFTTKCTPDVVVTVLSLVLMFSFCGIKYNLFFLNVEVMKDLLVQLQNVYIGLKDKHEIAIMNNYICNAKRYTLILTILAVCVLFTSVIILSPKIVYVILPMNVSLLNRQPIRMEYFIDQEKYDYLIPLHMSMSICITTIAMVAIGTIYVACLQYICGMFRISSFRIKRAVHINMLQNIEATKGNLILEGIISAVDMHRQAMKLSRLLLSTMETMMFCLIILGVVTLSINLFRIFQVISTGDEFKEFIIPSVYVVAITLYMFLGNYFAQDVTDHNNDIFATVCDVQWYAAPLHIQKLLLFLLQRGSKDFTLCIGGLFVASLECFATLLKTSFSYFTVMYSTQ